ncbi:MAG: NAD-dependent epimerase/dehydratase family protein [Chloroflexota bacterium]
MSSDYPKGTVMLEKYSRVMITGGAGFIGSYVCEEARKHGKHIVVIDDLSTGKQSNLPSGVEFLRMDIAQPDSLREAMKGVDLVFHVAAQPSTRTSVEDPDLDYRSNTLGTYNVLSAAREAGVRRFVYTSSSAVYGQPSKLPLRETDVPVPATPYGASKLCGEHYCTAFASVYGVPCTCLRPFNVYGPRENLEVSLDEVVQYTRAVMNGQAITVYGDGSQTRDFVYARDVARAHIQAANSDEAVGKVLNIGTGLEVTISDLVTSIESVTGRRAAIQYDRWPEGDIFREFGDVSLARETIGYVPETDLYEGLRQVMSALKAGGPWARPWLFMWQASRNYSR